MKKLSDESLFIAFQQHRDVSALSTLFRRRSDELLRLALFLVQRPSDAEDLVQATFLNAIARADSYRSGFRVMSWLCGILTNNARMLRRAARRIPPTSIVDETVQDPVSETLHEELRQVLRTSIAELGEPYRSVLTLHLDDGLNSREISERLHRPPATVRKQMARAIQQLRQALPLGLATGLLVKMNPAQIAAHAAEAAEFVESVDTTIQSESSAEEFDDATLWCEAARSPLRTWLFAASAVVSTTLGAFALSMSTASSTETSQDTAPTAQEAPEALAPAVTARPIEVSPTPPSRSFASTANNHSLTINAVDPNGMPHADLEVICVFDDGRALTSRLMSADTRRATTNNDGLASFQGLINGRYQLTVAGARPKNSIEIRDADREYQLTLPNKCEYRGTVTGPQGQPIAGAQVLVSETAGRGDIPHQIAVTNINGYFAGICLVQTGQIFARHSSYSQSVSRRMSPGRASQLQLEPLAETISIRVVDDSEKPVADCVVAVVPRSQSMKLFVPIVETTDSTGSCVLAGPGNRSATVIAQHPGMAPASIDLRPHKNDLLITMSRSTKVTGTVHTADGMAVPNREVLLSIPGIRTNEPTSPMLSLRSRTDSAGHFIFAHAPRADLHLRIYAKRNGVIGPPMSQHVVAGMSVDTRVDDLQNVELVIRARAQISGTLRRPDGTPIAGYHLLASPDLGTAQHRLFRRRSARTDANGRFTFDDIADDETYHVGIYPPTRWWPNRMTWPIAIAEVNSQATSDLVLDTDKEPSSSMTCQILRPDGKPARLASVEMRHLCFQSPVVISCDASGIATFHKLPPGDYWMAVSAPGLGSRTTQVTIDNDQQQLDLGSLQLEPPTRIALRMIHNGTRSNIPVRVVGRSSVGDKFVTARGQSNGTASLPPLPPGKVTLLIHGLGIAPRLIERDFQPGLQWIDVDLESVTKVKLRFPFPRVDNPFLVNGPLHVRIFDQDGALVLEDYVGATRVAGRFDFATGLRPGQYTIKARSLWNALGEADLTVPETLEEITADLPLEL